MTNLIKKNHAYICITTSNDNKFYISDTDKCIIAKEFIYIQKHNDSDKIYIDIINTYQIESIIVRDKDEFNESN